MTLAANCTHCQDAAWVWESHPDRPLGHGGCAGAGQPCACALGRALDKQLDQSRATGTASFKDLDAVTMGEPLWTLQKNRHTADARVRAIPGYGLELRFTINGELHYSQRFTVWAKLEQAAREKREDFEARGEGLARIDADAHALGRENGCAAMIPKALAEITAQDLTALVEASHPEGRTIDYKRELPGNSDDDKRNFLYDVTHSRTASAATSSLASRSALALAGRTPGFQSGLWVFVWHRRRVKSSGLNQ